MPPVHAAPAPTDRLDSGVTLVEVCVAGLVGGVLVAALAGLFTSMTGTVRSLSASSSSVAEARLGMEGISRTLRVAVRPAPASAAVITAAPQELAFWALLNRTGTDSIVAPEPTRVRYTYDGACLVQEQTRAGSTTSACLVRTNRPPTFRYYTGVEHQPDTGTAAPLSTASSGVPASELDRIRTVEVDLAVASGTHPAVSVLSRVTLQNLVSEQR